MIVGGSNYGQGSSREHAALAPMYLNVKAVLVESFARIHRSNLINFGIVPLVAGKAVIDALEQGKSARVSGIHSALETPGGGTVDVSVNGSDGMQATLELTEREARILKAGGLLSELRAHQGA